jgi:hypothetical protein
MILLSLFKKLSKADENPKAFVLMEDIKGERGRVLGVYSTRDNASDAIIEYYARYRQDEAFYSIAEVEINKDAIINPKP